VTLNIILSVVGGYIKVRESSYTCDIIWVSNVLKHVDTRAILPMYESTCMVYEPKRYKKNKDIIKYSYTIGIIKY
jgi:hypothetical protein